MSGVDLYKARQPINTRDPTLARPGVSGRRYGAVRDERWRTRPRSTNKWQRKEVKQRKNTDEFEAAVADGKQTMEMHIQCGEWAVGVTCEVRLGSESPPPPHTSVDEKWQQTGALTRSSRTTPQ